MRVLLLIADGRAELAGPRRNGPRVRRYFMFLDDGAVVGVLIGLWHLHPMTYGGGLNSIIMLSKRDYNR